MAKYKNDILELLYHNRSTYLSGQTIAERLAISRTAVWKTIELLKQQGFRVHSVQNKGYQLTGFPEEWDQDMMALIIKQSSYFKRRFVYKEVTSTQLVAKEKLLEIDEPFIVISEVQTAGRGRFNRSWDSQGSKGLWMTAVFRQDVPLQKMMSFNLFLSLAIAKTIRRISGAEAQIKWPNDIYIDDRKCCGFLTEISGEAALIQNIICGIGINLNHEVSDFQQDLAVKATSLKAATGHPVNRYQFLEELLIEIEAAFRQFLSLDFKDIKDEYSQYSNIWQRKLRYTEGTTVVEGVAVEILDDGRLVVQDEQGTLHHFMSADIEI